MAATDTAAPAQGATARARRRDPRYDVYELRQLQKPAQQWHEAPEGDAAEDAPRRPKSGWTPGADVEAWVLLVEGVRAPNDRAAIDAALDALARVGDARIGTFAAVLAGTIKPRTKARQVQETEVWQ